MLSLSCSCGKVKCAADALQKKITHLPQNVNDGPVGQAAEGGFCGILLFPNLESACRAKKRWRKRGKKIRTDKKVKGPAKSPAPYLLTH
jgi:hypothetical protein